MKIGVTAGAFDLLHPGHILLFEDCKHVCKRLIVLLQHDPSAERDWKNKPIQSLNERFKMLSAIKYIDDIIIYNTEDDLTEKLTRLQKVHSNDIVRIIGSEYKDKKITAKELNIKLHYHSRTHLWSSSELRNRIYKAGKPKKGRNK